MTHSVIAGGQIPRLECLDQRRSTAQALPHSDDLPMQGGTTATDHQFNRALIAERNEESWFAAIRYGEKRQDLFRMSFEAAARGCGMALARAATSAEEKRDFSSGATVEPV